MQDSKFGEQLYLAPRVPQGLAAAVEGLTREVIRHRPENIYAFAARHFENLLRLREQYDDREDGRSTSKKQQPKQLREVNEAARERYRDDVDSEHEEDRARRSGWTLNETAKVLERHRSIFGDSGQKVSTEQIRELANEPVLASTRQDASPRRKAPSDERKKRSPAAGNAPPRILSQIPIAKDIKTELKRNRISSRERKSVYTRETIIEKSSTRKSIERTKSYEMRSSRTEDCGGGGTRKRTTERTSKSRASSQEESTTRKKSLARGASMDSVKNYVVQNLVGMTSLDELQSPSYVEKVQEVIDETSSVIKEKVEALRRGAAAAAAAAAAADRVTKDRASSSSSSGEERSSGRRASSRRNSRNESSNDNKASLEHEASEESKSSLPAVRPPSSKSTSRSLSSARSEPDAGLTLPPISPESAKSPKDKKEELVLPVLSPPRSAAAVAAAAAAAAAASVEDAVSVDDTTAAVEEIAEDATASSSERTIEDMVVEDVEDAEENIEAAADEETADDEAEEDVAVTEAKAESVAEVVVPFEEKLVPPAEVADEEPVEPPIEIKEEKPAVPPIEIDDEKDVQSTVVTQQRVHEETVSSTTEVITREKVEEFISIEKQVSSSEKIVAEEASPMDLLAVEEEEFHDSLNVTPEPLDARGQRPDSLESSLAEEDAASGGPASPPQEPTLRDRLLEIEEAQRRIEDVLDETKATSGVGERIADKLIEIQESERRIEQILNAQSTPGSEPANSDIKNKLQELEEAERRIESVFAKEEATNATTTSEIESAEETRKKEKNSSVPVDPAKLQVESPSRAISPHSYILTEGSPYEIPASVTTLIIPERAPSPDAESLLRVEVEVEDEAFGEAVTAGSAAEQSTVGVDYIRGIKAASHDMMTREKNLDRIKEESAVDSEDERVLRVVTSSLEEILEKEELQANSLESTTARSVGESLTTTTTSTKETSVTTDPSPRVPALNLDSLADLTISSLNLTGDSPSAGKETREAEELPPVADSETETREFEKLERRLELQSATAASADIGAPAADINNVVCAPGQEAKAEEDAAVAEKESENNATQPQSQCTVEPISGSIDGNEGESDHADERKACHIYVPEASASKDDASSSSETSTFMSAATKIQAGVRGFLTRRRLQSTQKRSSTLDSVPSIQESLAVETSVPSLLPIVETTPEASKSRKKLRREDAVQRTTLSVENAFAEKQLQHTERRRSETSKSQVNEVEHLLEKILLGHAATNLAGRPKLVDVVLLQGRADAELQSKYLNFITSVEDVFGGGDPPGTPKGVIIEEITSGGASLEETTVASMSTSEDPLSINIEEVLGLGEEDESVSRDRPIGGCKLGAAAARILSASQDSPVMSDEHGGGARSPVTMMQIAQPRSVDDKSEENNPT